ncbi:FAD-containing oxidoreductase [Edaphobacter sp. 12200R-103]|jgi:pyruvate/2-oxoglutarate dehydrogenase complex dihydrolipoamide dehydrogenase (E3) component|uniref:FAD-containing oxidoreductase n=1 Tax=Edaphobacter sp. 12200R-103 TaxID=2703788 RepID=UPI00138D26B2|nr:FAD-containing oxidoreductase [Edaphobacter sp. 12200R-103]QHS50809.1 FAD-containing oxidoreductase [Edaphobacter sp. 12200R-103]
MTAQQFDAIIVGAGQAGPSLAGRLALAGHKVAMVERKLFGGTCVNTGCTPTKTLIASAYVAQKARDAKDYGIETNGPVKADMRAIKARKDSIVLKSRDSVESWLRNMENCTVYTGHARFESPTELRVGEDLLTAPQIFLNVGGRAVVPDMPGVKDVPFLTNTTLLDLDTLPEHLAVVGGSYVGIEFAQAFRRFGSEVTIVEMGPRLAHKEDEDVSAAIKEILEKEGIRIRLNAECIELRKTFGSGIEVHVSCDDDPSATAATHVLLAVGRQPNTDDLGLDKAGVTTDKRGYIQVDDQLRTSVPGIWAMGDCNGRGAFTHTAYNDFEIVAANLLDNDPRRVSDRIVTYGLFMDPPLGRVGMTEHEVRATGKSALIGTRPMTKVNRALEKGESEGFMKVLVDAENKQILGASILGTGGDEAIHCITDVMYAKAPYTTIQRAVHIHPTVAELIPTVLGDLKPLK